ncbi:hypothetical protein [uncultured Erythrobacter sp.]|uniref:hypothetical protein n=1 Tax=uncultured Erythrobacter sp. TaxID=263913 RepID=UPI002614C90D|nr:hypothetical protein [uncultured Erythrobacter sp.]
MQSLRLIPVALLAALSFPVMAQDALPAGIWTNTEDEYFAEEEGREKPDWAAFEANEDGQWRPIDAFGEAQGAWNKGPIPGLSGDAVTGWRFKGSELRRARPFFCWVSVRKFAGKPDGSEDWTFIRNLPQFDQGGRILVPGDGIAPDVTIRMRNVTWAKGSRNKPSLVLYVHKADPVRAESYSWAAPESTMIGINLRWVQASCSKAQSKTKGP